MKKLLALDWTYNSVSVESCLVIFRCVYGFSSGFHYSFKRCYTRVRFLYTKVLITEITVFLYPRTPRATRCSCLLEIQGGISSKTLAVARVISADMRNKRKTSIVCNVYNIYIYTRQEPREEKVYGAGFALCFLDAGNMRKADVFRENTQRSYSTEFQSRFISVCMIFRSIEQSEPDRERERQRS